MSVKNKAMAFLIAVSGMLGGKTLAQKSIAQEAKEDTTELSANANKNDSLTLSTAADNIALQATDSLATLTSDSIAADASVVLAKDTKAPISFEALNALYHYDVSDSLFTKSVASDNTDAHTQQALQSQQMRWENTEEGQEIVNQYVQAMQKLGEKPNLQPEDFVYIKALADFNHEMAMLDGTGYVMDREDFKSIIPDSLQNDLAESAKEWLTPSRYAGRYCNHAIKGNMLQKGLMLSLQNIVPACQMEEPLTEDPNFVKFEIKAGESCYVSNGGIKIYRKTRAHPYGHIGIAINDSTAEFSKDSSDKLREHINEDSYNGAVCFFTAHSEASFSTCIAAWATKYKEDNRPLIVAKNLSVSEFPLGLKPRQIFETAIACKEKYFEKYTAAIQKMPSDHVEENGYIRGKPIKIGLLAKNARRISNARLQSWRRSHDGR